MQCPSRSGDSWAPAWGPTQESAPQTRAAQFNAPESSNNINSTLGLTANNQHKTVLPTPPVTHAAPTLVHQVTSPPPSSSPPPPVKFPCTEIMDQLRQGKQLKSVIPPAPPPPPVIPPTAPVSKSVARSILTKVRVMKQMIPLAPPPPPVLPPTALINFKSVARNSLPMASIMKQMIPTPPPPLPVSTPHKINFDGLNGRQSSMASTENVIPQPASISTSGGFGSSSDIQLSPHINDSENSEPFSQATHTIVNQTLLELQEKMNISRSEEFRQAATAIVKNELSEMETSEIFLKEISSYSGFILQESDTDTTTKCKEIVAGVVKQTVAKIMTTTSSDLKRNSTEDDIQQDPRMTYAYPSESSKVEHSNSGLYRSATVGKTNKSQQGLPVSNNSFIEEDLNELGSILPGDFQATLPISSPRNRQQQSYNGKTTTDLPSTSRCPKYESGFKFTKRKEAGLINSSIGKRNDSAEGIIFTDLTRFALEYTDNLSEQENRHISRVGNFLYHL